MAKAAEKSFIIQSLGLYGTSRVVMIIKLSQCVRQKRF